MPTKVSFNYNCSLSGLISLNTCYLYDFGIGIPVKFSPQAHLSQMYMYFLTVIREILSLIKLLSNWINLILLLHCIINYIIHMSFYIIILLEKEGDIEEVEEELAKLSIGEGNVHEKKFGGKFQQSKTNNLKFLERKFKMNVCNNYREGINFIV